LRFFYVDGGPSFHTIYFEERRPLFDVRAMFLQTGKAAEAELEGVEAIFYVVGISPFDFVRLGEHAAPLATPLRRTVMDRVVGAGYGLRPQIETMRREHPDIRHYFIGTPLMLFKPRPLTDVEREVVTYKRAQVAAMTGSSIFDDVFMPDAEVLDDSLLSTRPEFFENGRQEAETFQGGEQTRSDNRHANGAYGAKVFERFVSERVR
jgi:hypothetical protein